MSINVLLCEDNPGDIYLIENSFQCSKRSYNIDRVVTGNNVMAYLRQEDRYQYAPRPDILMLDLNLPGKHGFEILQEIKAAPSLKAIPIVVFTSSRARKDVLTSYRLQASCYIVKPSDLQTFLEAIRQIENFWLGLVELPPQDTEEHQT